MAAELPDKIRRLQVHVGAGLSGELVRDSQYVFTYADDAADQPAVALLMPPSRQLVYQDGDLFPSMDMNLPEGYLFQRIKELHPKQPLSKMHMLALIGANGIGRVGYRMHGTQPPAVMHMSKADIPASRTLRRAWGSACTTGCPTASTRAVTSAWSRRSAWCPVRWRAILRRSLSSLRRR
jgi:serine/threonine-protein kinase HipA